MQNYKLKTYKQNVKMKRKKTRSFRSFQYVDVVQIIDNVLFNCFIGVRVDVDVGVGVGLVVVVVAVI